MGYEFCEWIIGGEAAAIVTMAVYIAADWKRQRESYLEELKSLKKMLGEREDE